MKLSIILILRPERDEGGETMNKSGLGWISYRNTKLIPAPLSPSPCPQNYSEVSPHTSQNDHHQKIYKQ